MKKQHIDPILTSMAASFYEPVYQRFWEWRNGQAVALIGFVRPAGEAARKVLEDCGAAPSHTLKARCFEEVWEVPEHHLAVIFNGRLADFDRRITEALGCFDGRYSAAAGFLQWGDTLREGGRQRFESRLLNESHAGVKPTR